MTLWIILTSLLSAAAMLLVLPLLRRADARRQDAGPSLAVYKDQLAEIERESQQDQIDAESAKVARDEIERRILHAAGSDQINAGGLSPRQRVAVVMTAVGFVVIGSSILYSMMGRPDLAAAPVAAFVAGSDPGEALRQRLAAIDQGQQAQTGVQAAGAVDDLIAGLAQRLEQNPQDPAGWRMLGWSYFNTQRYGQAADAYARAAELKPQDAAIRSAYAETLIRAADGLVTPQAVAALDTTLVLDPSDARARFFKGLKLEQDGDPRAAVDTWIAILKDAPADAEWVSDLRQRVGELAAASGIDVTDRLPDRPAVQVVRSERGPSAEDVAAAQAMPAEDRQAMIRDMVDGLADRLEQNPDDAEGWIKLMRSRLVLGERDKAQAALARARETLGSNESAWPRIAAAATELGLQVR